MRARNIKPGFYRNEQLADCSSWARLLFPGLWMLADRCGRLEFRPKRWKAELFPYDNVDIEALFSELEAQGLVVKYESGSMNLVWIPHFLDHQKPHKNERGSVLLPHPDDTRHNQGNDEQCSDDEDGTALVVPEHNQGCADEQPWPLPARLIPDSSLPESKKEENTGGGISRARTKQTLCRERPEPARRNSLPLPANRSAPTAPRRETRNGLDFNRATRSIPSSRAKKSRGASGCAYAPTARLQRRGRFGTPSCCSRPKTVAGNAGKCQKWRGGCPKKAGTTSRLWSLPRWQELLRKLNAHSQRHRKDGRLWRRTRRTF